MFLFNFNDNLKKNKTKIFSLINNLSLKKQCLKILLNKNFLLSSLIEKDDNYKKLSSKVLKKNCSYNKDNFLVTYIISISFTSTNTTLHVSDIKGNLISFCSAGRVHLTGKRKIKRFIAIVRLLVFLRRELKYIQNEPVALHLKNVSKYYRFFITRNLKNDFFIRVVRIFSLFPYNGCRNKKVRRKKIRTKKRN